MQNPANWYMPSPFPYPYAPWMQPANPYGQFDPVSQQYQSFIPLYVQAFPYYNPGDPKFQACRSRCTLLGLTPGTPSWSNCVQSCMRF
ncbi:hypothetical protein [Jeotgalibacillus proteolyticus]|uniref:hypothetical protein n=1 Tax=Jeotgalibacillus proteolyticus TaxID=2082395 RepID=UPI003CFB3C1E